MPNLGVPELIIIALVIFLLFGATRLPNAARSLGRSMRIFKSEMDEMKTDGDKKELAEKKAPTAEQQQAQNLAQPQAQPKTEQQPNE
ncbi:Sec-independent protein translocase subunit TatA [Corynebacterium macclintockiae]|uniref:Sec-independent protein translocase protein TatA n=1 Tax=Corynebacterium macclintockiae TaxID=2913501 RepID=A0A9X3M5Y9_9CORY|nr:MULTISPECIES: Sec-independent protein translocase subunit TatA [Corynebacterium]MBC6795844.1 twin-arginine translocase TatA/TatE family subunit [Corynebacterium sp. LK28]MCZ9304532.1 Sec-independent protein translocase subunit TatA [Corynebacterium macclintockiae]MDK8869053.1 Sec-independent protein translocase subunit TatA [Corynebacterium macclintockiae]MDK8890324.1 Sec-independent protein translocase subunit TatA [Corynebacterium macclintockiae]OFM59547.1 preprotein translocase subunit T